jgi:Co/Zn/Cd efflux system component
MSVHCCAPAHSHTEQPNPKYRRVLWIALVVNTLMFLVEVVGGWRSGSVSLLADAIDFAGDAANYALSLTVLSMGLLWRSRAAMIKGISMGLFGVFVLSRAAWAASNGVAPEASTMGAIALLALAANLGVAWILYAFRNGDADMRSVWLCTRNDAIGNVAVLVAAAGVFGTASRWPDLVVAVMMGGLALWSGVQVVRQARKELW